MSERPVSTADIIAALHGDRRALEAVRGYSGGNWMRTDEGVAAADRLAQFDAIEARLNTELATAYNKISELNTENERLRYSKATG